MVRALSARARHASNAAKRAVFARALALGRSRSFRPCVRSRRRGGARPCGLRVLRGGPPPDGTKGARLARVKSAPFANAARVRTSCRSALRALRAVAPPTAALLALAATLASPGHASAAPPATPPALPALPASGAAEGGNGPASARDAGNAANANKATGQNARDAGADDLTTPFEAARRGLVTVERDGRVLGLGTVLGGDGRILTALSALGAGESAEVRYADGSVANARLGHRDKVWDLALLVPLAGKRTDGLRASDADPSETEIRAFVARGPKPQASALALRGRIDAKNREGEALKSALDLDFKSPAPSVGAPLVDANGRVLGVVVRACRAADAGPCSVTLVGAPVRVLKTFLLATPPNAVPPSPFLGIVGAADASGGVRGVRVMAIAPQSPAEKGGLKTDEDRPKSDLIVAVNGEPVETPEQLAEQIGKRGVGDTVKLLVFSGGRFREASVTLRAAP